MGAIQLMKNKGFTLVELLIVIAIISILAVISVVNYRQAISRAELSGCMENLHVLGTGLNAYAVDYGVYPYADDSGEQNLVSEFGQGSAGNGYWDSVPMILYDLKYVTSKKTFYCPTLYKRYPGRRQYMRYAMNGSAFDTGGPRIKPGVSGHYWLAACLYVNSQWDTTHSIPWPHGEDNDKENVLLHTGQISTLKSPWNNGFDDPTVKE
jgi:prepilin-type N-terminal cleavage/methylation domain-containing protein